MDFIFSTACYIAAILFILWLRSTPSQPQVSVQPVPTTVPMRETSEISETSEAQPEAPVIADPWEAPAAPAVVNRRWVATKPQPIKPVLALCPAKESKPVESAEATEFEIDLNALDAMKLRKLCTEFKIQWRDVRGKNRHATKAMMVSQLEAKFEALQATA
jgi:hypothetical protein